MRDVVRIVSWIVVLTSWIAFAVPSAWSGEATAPAAAPAAAPAPPSELPKPAPIPKLTDERVAEMAKAAGLTSEVTRVTVEFIYKYKPRIARDLDNLLTVDPGKFKTRLQDTAYLARSLEALRKSEPARHARQEQTFVLEAELELLVDRYKEVSEGEKPHVEVQLNKTVARLFDLRLEEDRYQLELMRKQCDQMQARIDEKTGNKDRIVDRQVTKLLGIDEVLTW